MAPLKWTNQVYDHLLDAVVATVDETYRLSEPDEKSKKKEKELVDTISKAKDEFFAIDPSKAQNLSDFFKKHELEKKKVLANFNTRVENDKKIIPERRPKIGENSLMEKIRDGLCQQGKLCTRCKDTNHFRMDDGAHELCEGCYLDNIDKRYKLKDGTAARVWERSHGLCFYSGVRMKLSEAHLDHIYPKSINPKLTSEESNLCFCHGAINMAKNDTDPVKFLRFLYQVTLDFGEYHDLDDRIKKVTAIKPAN